MKINKRDRNALIICVVVVALAVYLVATPQASGSGSMYSKAVAEQKANEGRLSLRLMVRDEDSLRPRIASSSYAISAESLQPRVVRDLQQIAARAGVHLREVKPLRPSSFKEAVGASVPMEVRFRTAFQPNVVRFLYYLEDPAGKMVVQKIDVTSTDAKFGTVDVTARIAVFTRSLEGTGPDTGETSDADKTPKS